MVPVGAYGATPPLGESVTVGINPVKFGKSKIVKAKAKRSAAKDAKPKRRGRVAKRKVG